MAVQERLMTVDEFWAQYQGKRFELVKGVPREMAPTGHEHGAVSAGMVYFLLSFVRQHDLGRVLSSESGFYLMPGVLRAPDAAFIAKARLAQVEDPTRYTPFAPDLAVEVVSPGDTAQDIQDKVNEYLTAGTRLVWVIYPESRQVTVHHPGGHAQTISEEGALDGEDVLPGFSIPVRDLFAV